MKIELRKNCLIIAVTMTVMAIVSSQFSVFQPGNHAKKEVKTEQHEDNTRDEVYISLPSSMPSSTHVELSQTMVFLFEILFEKKEIQKGDFNILLPPNRFFKTLFDGVISPNAP